MDQPSHEPGDTVEVKISMKADLLRSDLVRGLVWFVNYAALDPESVQASDLDLQGTGMLPDDVEKFAHRWMAYSRSVDINHDGIGRPVNVVESIFNSPAIASPAFPINSHAARFDVSRSKEAFDGLRSGSLNSVSLDAITFNKVAKVKPKVTGTACSAPVPTNLSQWAEELAAEGFENVIGVKEVAPGLFVAMRSKGMPVAVSIDGEMIETSGVCSGPWARIGATLFGSPSVTTDHSPMADVLATLKGAGFDLTGPGTAPLAAEVFAVVDEAGVGHLPHHGYDGRQLTVSLQSIRRGLASIGTLPKQLQERAKVHLMRHLLEVET